MSNDILKFRAFLRSEGFMAQWDKTEDEFEFVPTAMNYSLGEAILNPDIEVMQWTGLYDSEGVEIYEGDIVELRAQWGGFVGDIIFECGCFGVKDGHTVYTFQDASSETLRIIGNIYESPDLMERPNG